MFAPAWGITPWNPFRSLQNISPSAYLPICIVSLYATRPLSTETSFELSPRVSTQEHLRENSASAFAPMHAAGTGSLSALPGSAGDTGYGKDDVNTPRPA